MQGRMQVEFPNSEPQPGLFDIGAREFISIGNTQFQTGINDSALLFQPSNARSLLLNSNNFSTTDLSQSPFRISGSPSTGLSLGNRNLQLFPLNTTEQQTLQEMISPSTRITASFPLPIFDPIPDPAGPNWNVGLGSKPDSTQMLQSLINSTSGMVILPGKFNH
jgi:hypothetical protein